VLWGNTQRKEVAAGTPALLQPISQTLLHIEYHRPETWHWLFSARIVGGGAATVGAEVASLAVNFEVITGIGRSRIKMPFFEGMNFIWTGGNPVPPSTVVLYTSKTFQARTFPFVLPLGAEGTIDQLVGEDINVEATLNYITDVVAAPPLLVELSGMMAPKNHIRPDWFSEEYNGNERGGR
jgi:hypothetical protein